MQSRAVSGSFAEPDAVGGCLNSRKAKSKCSSASSSVQHRFACKRNRNSIYCLNATHNRYAHLARNGLAWQPDSHCGDKCAGTPKWSFSHKHELKESPVDICQVSKWNQMLEHKRFVCIRHDASRAPCQNEICQHLLEAWASGCNLRIRRTLPFQLRHNRCRLSFHDSLSCSSQSQIPTLGIGSKSTNSPQHIPYFMECKTRDLGENAITV